MDLSEHAAGRALFGALRVLAIISALIGVIGLAVAIGEGNWWHIFLRANMILGSFGAFYWAHRVYRERY